MARVMYFESNRSSDDGMLAVGTVVMNRVKSPKFPNTVCGVVGQKNQFAPGVLSRPMTDSGKPRAERVAKAVLRGARHPHVKPNVMFFHTAGYKFPYKNMNYQVIAGGNAFYEKRTPRPGERNVTQTEVAMRQVKPTREVVFAVASASPRPEPAPIRAPVPEPRRTAPPTVFAQAAPVRQPQLAVGQQGDSIAQLIALNGG
ncbi:cell wall hydrolase [Propylenella binzhouense]|uniref:cell wall hydrolase n=1 Tax=Propylenella binzhouense TaxID=2555902 RepID=UPI003CCCB1C7